MSECKSPSCTFIKKGNVTPRDIVPVKQSVSKTDIVPVVTPRPIRRLDIMDELIQAVQERPNLGSEAVSHLPKAMKAYGDYKLGKLIKREAEDIILEVYKAVTSDKNVIIEITFSIN